MSNALYTGTAQWLQTLAAGLCPPLGSTTAPTSQSASDFDKPVPVWMMSLLSLGIIAMVIWLVSRLRKTKRLMLVDVPGRPNSLTAVHVLVLMVLWFLIQFASARGISLLMFGKMLEPDEVDNLALLPRAQLFMLMGLAGQIVMIVGGLLLGAWTFSHGAVRGMGLSLRHWAWDLGRAIFAYVAVWPACFGLLALMTALMGREEPHLILAALPTMPMGWMLATFVMVIVITPLAEEIFFRGLIQTAARRYTKNRWAAILIASMIFALAHVQYPNTVPSILVLGAVLGYNYERTGRLTPCIYIHAIFNAVSIVYTLS